MARLEDEFRHVLSSRALDALADLGSLSISTTWCQLEDASRRPQLPTWPVQEKSRSPASTTEDSCRRRRLCCATPSNSLSLEVPELLGKCLLQELEVEQEPKVYSSL